MTVLDDFAAPTNGIYAVYAQRKHLPVRLRLWIDFIKTQYADAAHWSGDGAQAAGQVPAA